MSEVALYMIATQFCRAVGVLAAKYRGTLLISNRALLGPYSRPMPWSLGWS